MLFRTISPLWQEPADQGSAEAAPVSTTVDSGEAAPSGESPFSHKYTGPDGKERTINSLSQLNNHLTHLHNQGMKASDFQQREAELSKRSKDFRTNSQRQTAQLRRIKAELDAKNEKLKQLPSDFWSTIDQKITDSRGPKGIEDRVTQLLEGKFSKVDKFMSDYEAEQKKQQRQDEYDDMFEDLATELGGEYADFDAEHAREFASELLSSSGEPGGLMRRIMSLSHELRSRPSAAVAEDAALKNAGEKARAKLASPGGMAQSRSSGPASDSKGKPSLEAARQRAQGRAKDVLE